MRRVAKVRSRSPLTCTFFLCLKNRNNPLLAWQIRDEHNAVFQAQLEVRHCSALTMVGGDLDVIVLQSIRRLRIKFIRKLGRARGRVSLNIVKKRDIIADYSDPSSQARFHALEL